MTRALPKLVTALPLMRRGDGPSFCRRFCKLYERAKSPGRIPGRIPDRIPPWLRLKDGPYFCLCQCSGFAAQKPVKIRRPLCRGRQYATSRAQTLAKEAAT